MIQSNGHSLDNCLACGSPRLKPILSFGNQPLANSYLELGELEQEEMKFPLGLNRCQDCHHLQLPFAVNPDLMFRDYSYVSGTSQTLQNYMNWFANFATEYVSRDSYFEPGAILDIACNDGTQLDYFKNLGYETFGIDPARNLYEGTKLRHHVHCGYLDEEAVGWSNQHDWGYDIINAQNVFAHNANPVQFLKCCARMMQDYTLLFIQNSQADMIKNGEFDTIYHEHHSFWCLNSMVNAATLAGLHVIDRIRTPIHGISDIFVLSKNPRPHWLINALAMEEKEGYYKEETYQEYSTKVNDTIFKFTNFIDFHSNKEADISGTTFIGYGAAAKGNTLLNVSGVTFNCIIDDNPLKQGKYTPGNHIPIISSKTFLEKYSNEKIITFIPLAWNFYDEIYAKVKKMRPNNKDKFVRYFPNFTVSE